MSDPLSSGRWDIEVSESRKDIPNDDNPLDSQSTKQFTKIIVDRDGNEIERLRPSKSDSAAVKKPIEPPAIVSSAPVKTLLPASSSVGSHLNKPKYRPSPPINPLSAILFTWLSPLLQLGSKRPLMEEDLFNPYTADKSDRVYQDFLVAYEAERQRQIQIAKSGSDSAPPSPRLWRVFWTQYKREILVANIIYGFVNADQLLAPYFLNRLVDFAQSRNTSSDSDSDWLGYRWAVCLFCSAIVSSFARAKSIEMLTRVAVRIRNILTLAIFNKALTISSARKSDGAIQSLMSVGPQQVVELASSFPNLYSAPLLIGLGVWQMSLYVGWAAVVGLAFMMLTLVPVGLMTAKQMALMKVYLGKSDHRIKLINEALQSIKVVKLYNWQRAFLGIITEARNEELRTMWDYAKVRGIVFGFLLLTPIMTAIIIFLTYSGTGGEMTASRVFTTLSLIAVIRFPFTFLPMALTGLTNMLVTFARTEQFLEKPDIIDRRTRVDRVGIELQEAEFTWTEDGSPEQQKKEEEKKDGKGKAKAAQDDNNMRVHSEQCRNGEAQQSSQK
jgi:ATP-binding cassette, subfamily C (CFTR/MRP), member 1